MTASAKLKGVKKRRKQLGPQSEQDRLFCERWLCHFDKDRAYREAGFTAHKNDGHVSLRKLEKFADYLRPIRDAKAKLVAERLMIDDEKVLKGMVKMAFFDASQFFERCTEPLTEWVKVEGKKEKVERVMMWDGKPVYGERMKPYSDLTPDQQAIVQITGAMGDRIFYRLPSIMEQHSYLTSLGRQYGMFADKLIVERHSHKHVHHNLNFTNVPTTQLQSLTRQLLPLVDSEFAKQLGYTPEEVEEASTAGAVLMPEKVHA